MVYAAVVIEHATSNTRTVRYILSFSHVVYGMNGRTGGRGSQVYSLQDVAKSCRLTSQHVAREVELPESLEILQC